MFLPSLLASTDDAWLANFAARWMDDLRPWARKELLRYIAEGCDRPWHRALVKRLFAIAEKRKDDELIAHFLVAFDRLVRHELKQRRRYSWQSKSYELRPFRVVVGGYRPSLQWMSHKTRIPRFTRATRVYLQRRALRYFRRMGSSDPARFRRGVITALCLYEQEHLRDAMQLLDARNLLQLVHRFSGVVYHSARNTHVNYNRQLADIEFGFMHLHAWEECFDEVWEALGNARSRHVRRAFIWLLQTHYPDHLSGLDLEVVIPLLRSPHPELQVFGVELLKSAKGVTQLAADEWQRLLHLKNGLTIPIVVELAREHLAPRRLSLEEKVRLASAPAQPVAALGLEWTKAAIDTPTDEELLLLMSLRSASSPAIRKEAMAWLGELLRAQGTPEQLRELLDSSYEDVREAALALVDDERFRDSSITWQALAESPYPEAQDRLLQQLEAFSKLEESDVRRVWATTLLAIHRGSGSKRRVLQQLAEQTIARESDADALFPLLGIALRSVRPAERRSALAQVVRAVAARPALAEVVAKHLPELSIAGLSTSMGEGA